MTTAELARRLGMGPLSPRPWTSPLALGALGAVVLGYGFVRHPIILLVAAWVLVFLLSIRRPGSAVILSLCLTAFMPVWAGATLGGKFIRLPDVVNAALLGGALLGKDDKVKSKAVSPALWVLVVVRILFVAWRPLFGGSGTPLNSTAITVWLMVQVLLPAVLAARFAADPTWLKSALRWLGLAAAVVGVLAVVESLTTVNVVDVLIPVAFRAPGRETIERLMRYGFLRAEGAFMIEILLGWFMGLMLVLSVGVSREVASEGPWRPIWTVLLGCMTAGLVFTFSGTPFLATLAGLGMLVLLSPSRVLNRGTTALAALLGGSLVAWPASGRLLSVLGAYLQLHTDAYYSTGIQANTSWRVDVYTKLAQWFGSGHLLFGYAALGVSGALTVVRDITSRYITELLTGGVVGLLTLMVPLVWAVVLVVRLRLSATTATERGYSSALVASFVVILAMFTVVSDSYIVETYIWALIGIAFALSNRSDYLEPRSRP
jgi:hypothetical protein